MKYIRRIFKQYIKNFSLPEAIKEPVMKASESNTYVETVSNKADCLHYHLDKNYVETLTKENTNQLKKIIKKTRIGAVKVIADITEEDFYGKVSGLYTHPWTREKGVEGKYRYLVAGILFRNKILPFYVTILRHGSFKADYLGEIVDICRSLGVNVKTMLLDKGFFSGDIITTLKDINYLIFAPKKELYKCMLEGTEKSCVIEHEIPYKKDKSSHKAETLLALVKEVQEYDWVFASNIFFRKAEKYVYLYKQRWNIETMFRVHDEARIKTKSKNPVIRLFYFMVSMFLLFLWNLYKKSELSFKKFVIVMCEMIKEDIIRVKA
jgi:putative transposase